MDLARPAVVALLLVVAGPARANLVADPGFEDCATDASGSPPGWGGYMNGCSGDAHSGSWAGYVYGSMQAGDLTQTIATTPGAQYEVSWWQSLSAPPLIGNFFFVSFGGAGLYGFGDPAGFSTPYQQIDVVATASGPTSVLDFGAVRLSATIDDVSVTPLSPVSAPEPAGLAAAAAGLAAVAAARRRR